MATNRTMNHPVTEHTKCRISGRPLETILDLGPITLNGFVELDDTRIYPKVPLTLMYSDVSKLAQLKHTVDPDLMFREYWYRSNTNELMQRHLQQLVQRASQMVDLTGGDFALDIGCNDGTMCQYYPSYVRTVGVDPAKNIDILPGAIDYFINDYFTSDAYDLNRWPRPKVITSIAMFYDIDHPFGFVQAIDRLLAPDGVWIVELHYLLDMLQHVTFDAICHEHLTYWSLQAFRYLLDAFPLKIIRAERYPINGGSLRLYITRPTNRPTHHTAIELLEYEKQHLEPLLEKFPDRVQSARSYLRRFLMEALDAEKIVGGYGASTKGNTLLDYYGLGVSLLPWIADRQPAKWGRKTAGTQIPIISEVEMRAKRPDYLLALPYHLLPAFLERERDLIASGTKFIRPLPEVTCLP